MKNKYLIKLLSILPQFIYKRTIVRIFREKAKPAKDSSDFEKNNYFNFESPKLVKYVYEEYFNEVIPCSGVSVELTTNKKNQQEFTSFFKEILGWDTFKLNIEENSFSFNQFFIDCQLSKIDLLVLNYDETTYEFEIQLEDLKVLPSLICINNLDKKLNENLSKYTFIEQIHNFSIYVNKNYEIYLNKDIKKNSSKNSKPVVNILSNIFQDSIYLDSFFGQLNTLNTANFNVGKIYLSTNDTKITNPRLKELADNCKFDVRIKHDPNITINPFSMDERARKWTHIFNENMCSSLESYSDFTIILEADLTYPSDVIEYLIDADVDIVAPPPILGTNFYDSWGYRKLDGTKIFDLKDLHIPIFESIYHDKNLVELSSVGSFFCVKTEYLRKSVRLPPSYLDGHLVGFCNGVRKFGGKVFSRTDVSIIHPTSYWKQQLWSVNVFIYEKEKIKDNPNLMLPGLEDVFIEPTIMTFNHTSKQSHYLIEYFKETKNCNLYCFKSEKYFQKKYENLKEKYGKDFSKFVYTNSFIHTESKYFENIDIGYIIKSYLYG